MLNSYVYRLRQTFVSNDILITDYEISVKGNIMEYTSIGNKIEDDFYMNSYMKQIPKLISYDNSIYKLDTGDNINELIGIGCNYIDYFYLDETIIIAKFLNEFQKNNKRNDKVGYYSHGDICVPKVCIKNDEVRLIFGFDQALYTNIRLYDFVLLVINTISPREDVFGMSQIYDVFKLINAYGLTADELNNIDKIFIEVINEKMKQDKDRYIDSPDILMKRMSLYNDWLTFLEYDSISSYEQ